MAEGNRKYLYGALPFLNTESIDALYKKVKAGNIKGFREEALVPFLSKDKVKELFDDLVANTKDEDLDEKISDALDEAFDDEDIDDEE